MEPTMEPESAKLQQVCRICLLHYKGTMTDIHHKPQKTCRIRDVLLTCLPLEISEGDKFPRFICAPCLTRLQTATQFRSIALQNDKYLRAILSQCTNIENLPVLYEKRVTSNRTLYKPIIKFVANKNGNASDKNVLKLSNHSNTIDKIHRPDGSNEATAGDNCQNKETELPTTNRNSELAALLRNDTITSDKENDQTSQLATGTSNGNDSQICEIITIDDDEDIPQQNGVSVAQNQTASKEKTSSELDLEQMRLRMQTVINNKIMEFVTANNNSQSQSQDHNHNVNINEPISRSGSSKDTASVSEVMPQKQNSNSSSITQNEKQNTNRNNLVGIQNQFQPRQTVINQNVSKATVTTNSIAMGFQDNNANNYTQLPNCATIDQSTDQIRSPNSTDISLNLTANRTQPSIPVTATFQNHNVRKTHLLNSVATDFSQNRNVNRIQQPVSATQTQPAKKTLVNKTPNQSADQNWQTYINGMAKKAQRPILPQIQSTNVTAVGFQQSQNVPQSQPQINSGVFQSNQNSAQPVYSQTQQTLPTSLQNQNVARNNACQTQSGMARSQRPILPQIQSTNVTAVGFQQNQNVPQSQPQISSATGVFQPNQNSAQPVYSQTQQTLPTSLQNQNVARNKVCQTQSGMGRSQRPILPQIQSTNVTSNQSVYNVQQPRSQSNEPSGWPVLPSQPIQNMYYTQNVTQTTNIINTDRSLFQQNHSTNNYFSSQAPNVSAVPSFQNVVTVTNQTQPVIYTDRPAVQPQNVMFAVSVQSSQQPQNIPSPQTLPYPQPNLNSAANLQWSGQNDSVPISYVANQPSSSRLLLPQSFNDSSATVVQNQSLIVNASNNVPNSVLYARTQLASVNLQQNLNNTVKNQSAIKNSVPNINVKKPVAPNAFIPILPKGMQVARSSQLPKSSSVIMSTSTSASSLPNCVNSVTGVPSNTVNVATDTVSTSNKTHTISVISPERINRNLLAGKNIGINITPPENRNPIQNAEIDSRASEVGIATNSHQIDDVRSSDSRIENLNCIDNLLHSLEQAHENPNQNTECESEYIPLDTGFVQIEQESSSIRSDIDRNYSLSAVTNTLPERISNMASAVGESLFEITDVRSEIEEKVASVDINDSKGVREILGNKSCVVVLNSIPLRYRNLVEKIKPAAKRKNSFEYERPPSTSPDNSSDEDWIEDRKRKKSSTDTTDSSDDDWLEERKRKYKRIKKNHSVKKTRKTQRRLVFSDEDSLPSPSNHRTYRLLQPKQWADTIRMKLQKNITANSQNQSENCQSSSVLNVPSASQPKETSSVSTVPNSHSLVATNTLSETDSVPNGQTDKLLVISRTNSENDLNTVEDSIDLTVDQNIDDNESKLSIEDVNTSTDFTVTPIINDDEPKEVTVNNNDLITIDDVFKLDPVKNEDEPTLYQAIVNDWDEESTDEVTKSMGDPLEGADIFKKTESSDEMKLDPREDRESYKCQHCNRDFVVEEKLKKHICELAVPKHACYRCSKRFTKIIDLQMHLGRTHCEEFQVCKKCSKVFNKLLHYLDHFCDENVTMVDHDLRDSPYNCGVCAGNFNTVESFVEHYSEHT